MTKFTTRAAIAGTLLATTATCGPTASPAQAQTTAPAEMPAAPVHSIGDENGVDLSTGQVQVSQTDVSIGPNDHRGLRYSRVGGGANWRDNVLAVIDGTAANPTISFGGSSEQFTLTDGSYVSVQGRGSTLTRDASGDFTYTASDGTVILFTDLEGNTKRSTRTSVGCRG